MIGYMEADFLGTPASTSIAVTNNAQLLRNRLYWVDLRKGGWEILGGQTWSLATPGRSGISPIPSDVFYTQNMDVNYQAGLFWGRIPELRFVYHRLARKRPSLSPSTALISMPAARGEAAASSFPTLLTTPIPANWTSAPARAASPLPMSLPDIIAKLALDPNKHVHFEIGGMERSFRVWDPGTAAGS